MEMKNNLAPKRLFVSVNGRETQFLVKILFPNRRLGIRWGAFQIFLK